LSLLSITYDIHYLVYLAIFSILGQAGLTPHKGFDIYSYLIGIHLIMCIEPVNGPASPADHQYPSADRQVDFLLEADSDFICLADA